MNNLLRNLAGVPLRAAPAQDSERKNAKQIQVKPSLRERLVLFAIGYREMYGLEIQRIIRECSDGAEDISIGSLYPTLHSLEQKGLVESLVEDEVIEERCGAKRKYYRLSTDGKTVLEEIIAFQNRLLSWEKA